MSFTLKPLPFAQDALDPVMSARTLQFHHGKHHAGYVAKLNELVQGTEYADLSLEDIVSKSEGKNAAIFNNAAQIWNHDFFWESVAPNGGGTPPEPVARRLEQAFGSVDNFRKTFVDTAVKQFGSGWAWLVLKGDRLEIVSTSNAQLPFTSGAKPLVTCDVWEHAYYLDYQNERARFVQAFLDKLINWQLVGKQLSGA